MGRIFLTEVPSQRCEAVLNAIPLLNDVQRRGGSYCQRCFRPLSPRSEWWTYRKDLSYEAKKAILNLVTKAKDIEEESECDAEEPEAELVEGNEESEAELDFFDDEEVEPSPVEHAISEHEAFLNQYVDVAEV